MRVFCFALLILLLIYPVSAKTAGEWFKIGNNFLCKGNTRMRLMPILSQ